MKIEDMDRDQALARIAVLEVVLEVAKRHVKCDCYVDSIATEKELRAAIEAADPTPKIEDPTTFVAGQIWRSPSSLRIEVLARKTDDGWHAIKIANGIETLIEEPLLRSLIASHEMVFERMG